MFTRLGLCDNARQSFRQSAMLPTSQNYSTVLQRATRTGATAADLGAAHVLHAKPPQLYWLGLRPVHGRGQGDQRPMHYATSSHGGEVATLDDTGARAAASRATAYRAAASNLLAPRASGRNRPSRPRPCPAADDDDCARLKDRPCGAGTPLAGAAEPCVRCS